MTLRVGVYINATSIVMFCAARKMFQTGMLPVALFLSELRRFVNLMGCLQICSPMSSEDVPILFELLLNISAIRH